MSTSNSPIKILPFDSDKQALMISFISKNPGDHIQYWKRLTNMSESLAGSSPFLKRVLIPFWVIGFIIILIIGSTQPLATCYGGPIQSNNGYKEPNGKLGAYKCCKQLSRGMGSLLLILTSCCSQTIRRALTHPLRLRKPWQVLG